MRTCLLKRLNPLLCLAGLELVRRSRFMDLVAQLQSITHDFSFLQIGAHDGRSFDDQFFDFVTKNNGRGVVVEPLQDVHRKLVENYRGCPRVTPLNLAVHPTARCKLLYHVARHYLSSLPPWASGLASFSPDHHKRSGIPDHTITTTEVRCVHLMSLIHDYSLDPLHLLQIDTEGFDAEVIRMIDFSQIRPLIIKYEHINLQPDQVRHTRSKLKAQGYRCFKEGPDTVAFLPGFAR